jgi:hypothetical protein
MDKYCVRFGGFIDKDGPEFPELCQRFVKAEVAEALTRDLAYWKAHDADWRKTYDALAAELAAYKLEDVQWEEALARVAGDKARIAALEAELADHKVTVHAARLRAEETGARVSELEWVVHEAAQPEISPRWVPRSWHEAMMAHLRAELAATLLEHEIGNQAQGD